DAIDRSAIDHQHAGTRRKQVGAAGEGALDIDAFAGDGLCDRSRGSVLGDVAWLQPHDDDVLDAGLLERGDFGRADRGALLQHQRSVTKGVDGDPANRLRRTGRTELHAAASFSFAGRRSCAVISAMIATAISDGDTAPMGRPIGAWMRAMSASFAPCARKR